MNGLVIGGGRMPVVHQRQIGGDPVGGPLKLQVPVEPPPRILLAEQDHQQRSGEQQAAGPQATVIASLPGDRHVAPEAACSTMALGRPAKIRKPVLNTIEVSIRVVDGESDGIGHLLHRTVTSLVVWGAIPPLCAVLAPAMRFGLVHRRSRLAS
jgi:hypothetical protein